MDGYFSEIVTRVIKYIIEGLAIAVAATLIPRKSLPLDEVLSLALLAASVFAVLDTFSPSVGVASRNGAGLGIGLNLVGFPM